MRHADTLAALREPGRTDTQCRELLAALASSLPRHDAVADIISRAADAIEDYEEGLAAVSEMRADDLDNDRLRYQDQGEFDKQAMRELSRAI